MAKLPQIKPRKLIALLEQEGFIERKTKSSHVVFAHPDGRTTTVPVHNKPSMPAKSRVITRDLGFGQVYPRYQPNLGVILLRSKSNKTEFFIEIISRLDSEKVLSDPEIATSLTVATLTKTRII